MAKYIKQEMPDLDGSGKQRVYYRIKTRGTLSGRDFIKKVAYTGSGLSEGNVMHVLTIVAKELAYYMGQGYTVNVDGVGTFKPTIGLVEDKEMDDFDSAETKRNARSLQVNGVNFRDAKELYAIICVSTTLCALPTIWRLRPSAAPVPLWNCRS